MTFKHVKFEDSAVMRSLEKVASQKGLVKSEPLNKTASKQADLFPTTNLTENILKLCEGLRHQGFNKYADELEDKFVVYKQAAAATLYETTSEEGKDLIDAAHPKGSHHLEGLDSDEAVIETILDQHLKDTKMVEKTPTGKLASSAEVISAVKKVLGAPMVFDPAVGYTAAPGTWSRLLGLFSRAPAASGIELATAPGASGAGAAAVGGGEVAAGGILSTTIPTAGAAGAAAIGASVAAVIAAAVVGGYIGSVLFDHYYSVTDLKEAGDRLLSEIEDVKADFTAGAESNTIEKFARAFNRVVANYKVVEQLKSGENVSPQTLASMKELSDLISESNKQAQAIWSYAMGHKDEQFLGFMRGFGDVVLSAKNYMEVSSKMMAAFDDFAREAINVAQKQVTQQVSSHGGAPVVGLQKDYSDTLADLAKYKQIIQAKRLDNASTLTAWLDKIKGIVDSENAEFTKTPDANKSDVSKYFSDRLNNQIRPKIKAFVDKWMS